MGWRQDLEHLKQTDPEAANVAQSLIRMRLTGEYSSYDSLKEKFGQDLTKLLLANDHFMKTYKEG